MYKLIVTGAPGAPYAVNANIPYPFETVGTNPVHAPADNSLTITSPANGVIKVGDYGFTPSLGITPKTISMNGNISSDGSSEVTIHLRYGLLGTQSYTPLGNLDADYITGTTKDIPNYAKYNFVATETNSNKNTFQSEVIESENIFKKIAGFGGVVRTPTEDPVVGAQIDIYTTTVPPIKINTTPLSTDENGYYQFPYKYNGKQTSFTVKLTSPVVQQLSATVKSNTWVITNFTVP